MMKWIFNGHFIHEKGSKSFGNKTICKCVQIDPMHIAFSNCLESLYNSAIVSQLWDYEKKNISMRVKKIQSICLWLWVFLNRHFCKWWKQHERFVLHSIRHISFIFCFVFISFSQCEIWNFLSKYWRSPTLKLWRQCTKKENKYQLHEVKALLVYYFIATSYIDAFVFYSFRHHQNEIVQWDLMILK